MNFQSGSKNVTQSKIYLSRDLIPTYFIILFSYTKNSTILHLILLEKHGSFFVTHYTILLVALGCN